MALTGTLSGDWFRQVGNINEATATIAFDSSYPTGGETFAPKDVGLRAFETGGVDIDAKSGYTFEFDYTNNKILAYRTATLTPVGSVAAPTFTGTANVGTAGIVQDDDTAATNGHALYVVPVPQATPITLGTEGGTGTGLIQDDDTAATTGVAVYVVLDDEEFLPTYALGHFEFVSPTNAHGTCTISSGGPTLLIEGDDSPAKNGGAGGAPPARRGAGGP